MRGRLRLWEQSGGLRFESHSEPACWGAFSSPKMPRGLQLLGFFIFSSCSSFLPSFLPSILPSFRPSFPTFLPSFPLIYTLPCIYPSSHLSSLPPSHLPICLPIRSSSHPPSSHPFIPPPIKPTNTCWMPSCVGHRSYTGEQRQHLPCPKAVSRQWRSGMLVM